MSQEIVRHPMPVMLHTRLAVDVNEQGPAEGRSLRTLQAAETLALDPRPYRASRFVSQSARSCLTGGSGGLL